MRARLWPGMPISAGRWPGSRIRSDGLPAPAVRSELNPVEGIWPVLKRSLANLAKHDITQLTALVKTRLRRMQHRPGLVDSLLTGTRLDLTSLQ